jgi:PAS domain S-box-containing protein
LPEPSQPKLLLVAHDPVAGSQMRTGLAASGLTVAGLARSRDEAVRLALELRPDLALVQLARPREAGIEIARTLREQFDVPVIFVTDQQDETTLRAAMLAEPYGCVAPPYETRSWRTIIDISLYRHEAEQRVNSSRAEQSAIIHAALDGFWLADLTGRLLDVNEAYCRLSGYSRAELLQMTLADLADEASRPGIPSILAQIARDGAFRFERRHLRKDGTYRDVEVSANYLPTSGGRLFAFVRDITERKRADQAIRASEQALSESESKFARAFKNSPVMMALSARDDGMFVEVNDQFVAVSEYSREEVIGRRSTDIAWVESTLRRQLLNQLITEGHVREVEIPARTKSGRMLRVLYSGELLQVGGRNLILSAWRDVTAQRQAEATMRLQMTALEAAANAIVITDRRGVIEWANTAFTRYSGYSPAEFTGRTFKELVNSGHHDEAFFADLWRTVTAGRVWHGEITNRRKDDTTYIDETTITPVHSPDGAISHFIAVKQDVTQRKTLEEQFRQAQKMEAIGQLAGGVAHDFNNILAAVLMYLGIMQDEPATDPGLRNMLKELQKEVKRGAGLTRQLLMFSRQQAIEPQALDLDHVIDGLMKMLARLLGEHIATTVKHAPQPLPAIEADPGMMEQVIINLCVNARDAMEQGGRLTLQTSAVEVAAGAEAEHPQGRPGHFVRLDVIDTGCGMDDRTLQRIFEPFFTTKPAGKGTGLGLATVYGIVKQHRGWIEVRSAVGHGTTFSVFLPVAGSTPAPRTDAEPGQPARGSGEAILLVEDDPNVRSVMTQSLRLGGYRVLEADSGPKAIDLWRAHANEITLLLTDMVMPDGMDGRALATKLRSERPTLRVVLCTGYSQAVGRDTGEGMTLLRKPFGAAELLTVVRGALDAK